MRDDAGKVIAAGDIIQQYRGPLVTTHVVLHFRDGSLDDETTVFTERRTFHLVSDRHIQRGPSYPHPLETYIDTATGMMTVHSTDKNGEQRVTTDHIDMPPDLGNGLDYTFMINLPASSKPIEFPLLIATPKPRLIKMSISSRGEESCFIAGVRRKVTHYAGKIELGGVEGALAPLIGKQPEDAQIWVLGGEVPTLVKVQTELYPGGPVWTIELAAPSWPAAPAAGKGAKK